VFRYTVYCLNLAFVLQDFNKRNDIKRNDTILTHFIKVVEKFPSKHFNQ